MTAILGIDIAKQTFDATLLDGPDEKRRRHFDNTARGHEQLHQWVPVSYTHLDVYKRQDHSGYTAC